jgi:hypothetical protein
MADGTLSPNSRKLKDGEVVDITKLAPEGYGTAQDIEDILDADHVSPSMVDDEEPLLKQARVGRPPLPQNKGKGHARTPSKESVIVRPSRTTPRVLRRDPSRDNDWLCRSRSTAHPPWEMRSRQSIAESDQHSEYSSMSHHSSYDTSRQMDLTPEMAEIKEQLAWSANIRVDAQWREKEAKEETARSQLRLNNLEITLRNVQHDTERRLKTTCSHSKREAEPAVEKQQQERRMPLPPNLLGTTGKIDNTSCRQHHS